MGPLLRIANGRYLPSLRVIWSSRATESNPQQCNMERPLTQGGGDGVRRCEGVTKGKPTVGIIEGFSANEGLDWLQRRPEVVPTGNTFLLVGPSDGQ